MYRYLISVTHYVTKHHKTLTQWIAILVDHVTIPATKMAEVSKHFLVEYRNKTEMQTANR